MSDETSRLVVSVHGEGINETASQLAGLQSQARATEISIQQLQNAFRQSVSGGILDANFLQSSQSAMEKLIATSTREGQAILGITTATKENTQINQQSGESFGSLALKIAGYSSALNLGISVVRNAISGMVDLGKQAVELAGQFERSRVAWGVFLKDVDAGSQMFDKLYDLAQRTPLSFQGVESAAQMLKGFGLQTEEIIPTLERMGDVARGNDETMQRLALAYGQALAQGRVLTRDLYQFVNAGVPIFDALATVMGKSVQQVQQLVTDGKVGFPEIEAALKSLTGQGGQFEGMMERASQTYEGKLSIAKDNWKAMLAEMGSSLQESMKGWLDEFNKISENILTWSNVTAVVTSGGKKGNADSALKFLQQHESNEQISNINAPGELGYLTYGQAVQLVQSILEQHNNESAQTKIETQRNKILSPGATPTAPLLKTDEWRTVLTNATGIDANSVRPIKQNGAIVDWQLPSGAQIANEWVAQTAASFFQYKGTPREDEWRSEFTNKANDILDAMLGTIDKPGLWKPNENTVKIFEQAIQDFGTQKKTAKDTYQAPIEYPDRWITKIGGGNAFMTPEEAQFALESIDAKIASDQRVDAWDMAARAPSDRWANKVGGGIPFLTPEAAEKQISAIDTIVSDYISDFAFAATQRAPSDKYLNKVGAGIPYKTPEEAQSIIEVMDAFIASGLRSDVWEMSARAPTDRWMNKSGGGIPFLTQEEASLIIEPIDAAIASGQRSDAWNMMSRAPTDKYLNKVGAGVAYLTPEEAAAEIAKIEAKSYVGITQEAYNGALRYPTDKYTNRQPGDLLPGLGKEYLTPEEVQAQIYAMELKIAASNISEEAYAMAGRAPPDKYLARQAGDLLPGYGKAFLTPEEALYQNSTANLASLLEANRKAMEGPATGEKNIRPWMRQTPGAVNPETGDIYGYYSDSTLPSGKIPKQIAVTDAEKYAEALKNLNANMESMSPEGYAQELQKINEQYDSATKAAKTFEATMKDSGLSLLNTGISSLSDELYELGDALADGSASWDSFGDSMGDALEAILKMIPKLAIQAGLQLIASGQYAVGIALVGAGLVGQVTVGALDGNALGGVYDSPSLSQYSNGIYDKPHLFTYANGGVFGEAGPEAIMPLSRDSSGRLGVSGGSSAKVDIQIINQSSTPVSKKTTTITDAAGNKKIMVWIKDVVKQEVATANAGGVKKS